MLRPTHLGNVCSCCSLFSGPPLSLQRFLLEVGLHAESVGDFMQRALSCMSCGKAGKGCMHTQKEDALCVCRDARQPEMSVV